jgi:uncharacterized protein (DUF427 family)
VWDYPRPPACEPSSSQVVVRLDGEVVAESHRAYRVLETSHPPGWYVPAADVRHLRRSRVHGTVCEWKGTATYWDVVVGSTVLEAAAWSYETPTPGFAAIAGYLAFMPTQLDCRIDGERAMAQDGGFYGGWVTGNVVGPFKGGPGSYGW